jgi:ABC-2 type transport system permease protein
MSTTYAPVPSTEPATHLALPALPPAIPFSRLLRVEWRKSIDTRAARWLLLVVGLLSIGLMLIPILNPSGNDQDLSGYLSIAALGVSLLLPVVSILTLTSEWNQRTVLSTFTAEPRRGRVLGAKVGAGVILALLGSVLAYALAFAGLAVSGALGRDVSWTQHPGHILGVTLFLLLNVAMAMGFGALIQNTPAAIVAYFAVPTVISMIGLAVKGARDWFDSSITFTWILEGSWTGHLGPIATTTALWVALPLAAGAVRTIRREVK